MVQDKMMGGGRERGSAMGGEGVSVEDFACLGYSACNFLGEKQAVRDLCFYKERFTKISHLQQAQWQALSRARIGLLVNVNVTV